MRFYQVDPTQDLRWAQLVIRHPRASVFHSAAWLKALRCTYGYEPVAFTTSSPADELKNGMLFCHVDSMLTGHRLVSLPFSDHCEPLFDSHEDIDFFVQYLKTALEREHWRYVEVRPVNVNFGQAGTGVRFVTSATYFLHILDLQPDLDTIFRSLDKDSVQRRVQRAQQAGLTEKCGTSDDLLKEFYRLLVITRRRHQLPPPPFAWFRNLIHSQGEALEIRLAYENETPIAAVFTLRFKGTIYYKYGCSDARFNKFGAMPWLLWNAIAAAKSSGATEFDMGRTEGDNTGLLAFKNHWVPHPKQLVYWRFPESSQSASSADSWKLKMAKRVFAHMPSPVLTITGKLLYRHIG
jgi:lipid II:glycine glycyltransferase (peptidoglycan interpeptide bridge formation enzyme)